MISVKTVRNLFLMVSKSRCQVVEAKKAGTKTVHQIRSKIIGGGHMNIAENTSFLRESLAPYSVQG